MTKPICKQRGEPEQPAANVWAALQRAAERVCWFDWSDNDEDAVASIDALRAALAKIAICHPNNINPRPSADLHRTEARRRDR